MFLDGGASIARVISHGSHVRRAASSTQLWAGDSLSRNELEIILK